MSISSGSGTLAYVGLGANLGEPRAQLEAAIEAISHLPDTQVEAQSDFYRSAPWGIAEQPEYVNAAVKLRTHMSARELLEALLQIEKDAGRRRGGRQWGPRLLDLDILLYGEGAVNDEDLVIPHPRIAERNFVLAPLLDLEPGLVVPGMGSVQEMLAGLGREGLVRLNADTAAQAIKPRVVVEGAPHSGARRLALALAAHWEVPGVVDEQDNPFAGSGHTPTGKLAAQLHNLFRRQERLEALRQTDLFAGAPVLGYLPQRSLLEARAVLGPAELKLFEQVAQALSFPTVQVDMVVYLQVSPRVASRRQKANSGHGLVYSDGMLEALCGSYRDLFYDYDSSGVLTVNADHGLWGPEQPGWTQLLDKVSAVKAGRHYFNPVAAEI